MSSSQPATIHPTRPLRLWPGVALLILEWLTWFLGPVLVTGMAGAMISALGTLAGGLLVVVWWVFFSRAGRLERWGGLALLLAVLFLSRLLLHESLATAGMSILYFTFVVPVLCLTLVAYALARSYLPTDLRLQVLAAGLLLAGIIWIPFRLDGVTSSGAQWAWRWSPTAEEQLLARGDDPAAAPGLAGAAPSPAAEVAWPGFRGPARDGVIPGVRIATDWSATPPQEIWRRPVGPAWSSFATDGTLIYTQEQRGAEEIVACYDLASGAPVWRHGDPVRFWESNAGAGPRGTPALHQGRVYTLGATGLLNALDARDGRKLWSRDVAAETNVEVPYWGFAGSPLVMEERVIVAVAGTLAAYDPLSGEAVWSGAGGGGGYSSPHPMVRDGVSQAILMGGTGAISVAPVDGAVLWQHPWPGGGIVQPALTPDGDLLISTNELAGMRRISIAHDGDSWSAVEKWSSRDLKPDFNDFVIHAGHAYGFDGSILACIDIADGRRRWKGGRYGKGQLILLPDQDLLLVISEKGELVLVPATPDGFSERARFSALDGKTWNHPVLVADTLLVRNDQEMAAFRLSLAGGSP